MTTPPPPEQVDLPADALPPELEGLVSVAPDGAVTWTRSTSTPARAWTAAAVGAGVSTLLVVSTALLLAARIGGEIGFLASLGLVLAPMVALFSGPAFSRITETVRVDGGGVTRSDPIAWAEGDQLVLHGGLESVRVHLDRVDASGQATTVRSWTGARAHREHGWDIDSIRWFAQRVADVSGLPLTLAIPDDAAWQARDAERAEKERIARERRQGKLEDYATTRTPTPLEGAWDVGGVTFRIPGPDRNPLRERTVSYDPHDPVRVERDTIRIHRTRIPVGEVLDVRPWFGFRHFGKVWAECGEVHAITARGHIVLAQRTMSRVPPEVVLGAAIALREAVMRARDEQDAERGTDDDVPNALRDLTARRVPEGVR